MIEIFAGQIPIKLEPDRFRKMLQCVSLEKQERIKYQRFFLQYFTLRRMGCLRCSFIPDWY